MMIRYVHERCDICGRQYGDDNGFVTIKGRLQNNVYGKRSSQRYVIRICPKCIIRIEEEYRVGDKDNE